VCVLADERGRVAASVGSCAIEITGNGDRRHSARWSVGEFLFERVVSRLALGEAQPPAVQIVIRVRPTQRLRISVDSAR
jgi:hypothetical protein